MQMQILVKKEWYLEYVDLCFNVYLEFSNFDNLLFSHLLHIYHQTRGIH